MRAVRLSVDVNDTEIVSLVHQFLAITGQDPWARKVRVMYEQGRENQFLCQWQLQFCGIEFKLAQLLARQHEEGLFPINPEDELHYELYGFVAGVVRIYEQLTPFGQNRLRGMLLDGLKPDNHLLSLQHEVLTAVHLAQRGYDLVMNDLETGSGVDFIAERDGVEMEVECKLFTGDVGRKIHRRKVYALHHHLRTTIARAYKNSARGLCVRVTLPDRLNCGPAQLAAIESALSSGLLSGTAITKTDACEVEVNDFDVASSPFNLSNPHDLSMKAVQDFGRKQLGRFNKEIMVFFSPGKRAVLALIESEKPDDVLNAIARDIRESARKQFTKTRPGILAVQLHDLTADQMESLGKSQGPTRGSGTGLQIMTSDFLDSPKRAHIHTVVYRSHGRLSASDSAVTSSGPAYSIRNPHNSHHADPRCRVFSN